MNQDILTQDFMLRYLSSVLFIKKYVVCLIIKVLLRCFFQHLRCLSQYVWICVWLISYLMRASMNFAFLAGFQAISFVDQHNPLMVNIGEFLYSQGLYDSSRMSSTDCANPMSNILSTSSITTCLQCTN